MANATEAQADEAVAILKRAIDAAQNSNQAGENAVVKAAAALVATPWTDEELEDLIADAISDAADMDTGPRDYAKAILRELAKCGLHITWTPARLDLLSNPPVAS